MTLSYSQIPNHFNFEDVYDEAVLRAPAQAIFVEVGTWLGASAAYMAGKIRESGKRIHFYAVDNFTGRGAKTELRREADALGGNFFAVFCENMRQCGVSDYVSPIIGDSTRCARHFKDRSLDFVYIDACHEYRKVRKDINAWLRKMKIGGTIAGHDYNAAHPGVREAVNEIFAGCTLRIRRSSWVVELREEQLRQIAATAAVFQPRPWAKRKVPKADVAQ